MISRNRIRSVALMLPLLGACAATPEGEPRGKTEQAFTSEEAVLLDFELDGRVITTEDVADPRPLIETQLTYTIGQLNGERAVGRYGRLELSNIKTGATGPDTFEVTYHARLPVAWGSSRQPATYAFTVPARVGQDDQALFASRYGASCVDASAGEVSAGSMFLFYRPQAAGCVLEADDVATFTATVKKSVENTKGKYPEYHRIWEDGALDVVAMFSHAEDGSNADDVGLQSHARFIQEAQEYLRSLQPNATRRTITVGGTDTRPITKLSATLVDGRVITIDVMLVGYRLQEDGASFDRWYDGVTPAADLILYNGHAGLGDNVQTLMQKGTFRPRQYVIWSVNGCDTFAYVDSTLAQRRAALNPDDPLGTKYMDTVSNVMSGYFETTPEMSMTFITALAAAGARGTSPGRSIAKTYEEICASVDPNEVIVVTGEEDNEFEPGMGQTAPNAGSLPDSSSPSVPAVRGKSTGRTSCNAGRRGGDESGSCRLFAFVGLVAIAARRRLGVGRGVCAFTRPASPSDHSRSSSSLPNRGDL